MASRYPGIVYTEEGMREGMQIENKDIPVDQKVALLDALSETGLKQIVIGSFVSPKYTPQMARIDEIVSRFTPKPGVIYTALALNEKGVERAKQYSPPLTIVRGKRPQLRVHQCDVFARRNTNRSQMQEMAAWQKVVDTAVATGVTEAGIGTNATFGSNFVGDFTVDMTMKFLEKQHALWDAAGIKVTSVSIGDPMGWCHPVKVEEIFTRVKRKWPEIDTFSAHLHNARGMAITSACAAIQDAGRGRNPASSGHYRRLPVLRQRPGDRNGADGRLHAHAGRHGHRNGRRSRQADRLRVDAGENDRPLRPGHGLPRRPAPHDAGLIRRCQRALRRNRGAGQALQAGAECLPGMHRPPGQADRQPISGSREERSGNV